MDFTLSPKVVQLQKRVSDFMNAHVYPIEKRVEDEMNVHGKEHVEPEILKEVRKKAKAEGLWNLFMPDEHYGKGLKVAEYAPLSELMGRTPIGSRAFNCMAPDTGNMEILADFGTAEQKKRWLEPCLEGTMRTCYSMTEPETAGSDPTQLATRAVRDGDDYVINGHKWFTSGAVGASFAIAMVVTDPKTDPHRRASQIIVPTDTPGFQLVRAVSVMGHAGGGGHCEIIYKDCRVPVTNLLGEEGSGFAIAQARLGPGRIHHCMRAIGVSMHALELMCQRATTRVAFGKPLAEQGMIQDWIAQSYLEIEQARLLTLKAAWMIDNLGKKAAQNEIAMIKIVAPQVNTAVVDRAIQVFGGAGLSDDFPLASMWAHGRTLHIVDGPDEVHKRSLARSVIGQL